VRTQVFGVGRQLSLKSWKICAPQQGAVIYFPFSAPELECSANIELNGPGQSSFLRSIISWWLGALSNSISSTIYQSQLRFTFALADVNVRLTSSPRSLQFSRSESNCWGRLFSKNNSCKVLFFFFFAFVFLTLLTLQPLSCRPKIYTVCFLCSPVQSDNLLFSPLLYYI